MASGTPPRRSLTVIAVGLAALCAVVAFACSQTTDVERAERNVKNKQEAVNKAQSAYDTSVPRSVPKPRDT